MTDRVLPLKGIAILVCKRVQTIVTRREGLEYSHYTNRAAMNRLKCYWICAALLAAVLINPARAMAQTSEDKPRMTILNLVPQVTPIDSGTGMPMGLPSEFRKVGEFEITGRHFTGRIIKEWVRAGPVAQRKRAEKLGRIYDVQLMVSGRVHAIQKQKWVVSFVKLNVPPTPGKPTNVNSESEFFTILDESDPGVRLVLLEHSSAFGYRETLAGNIRKRRVCEDAIPGDKAKSLLTNKVLVILEQFYVKFGSNGTWESSSNPFTLSERGKWWMEGKRLCETVPNVKKPPCRCLKKNFKGGYRFVWEGGSEQQFRFH